MQNTGRSKDDLLQSVRIIVVEPKTDQKTRADGSAQKTDAGRGSDESKVIEFHRDAAGVGSRVDHEVEYKIFHCGVKVFFGDFIEAVDFVDKKDVALFQMGQYPCEIARFFNSRSGGNDELSPHRLCNDVG